jgi:invasion protein IalB
MQHTGKRLLLAAAIAALSPTVAAQAQQASADQLWKTRCAGPARALDTLVCEASQAILVKESGQLLFKIDIIYPAQKGKPVFQMQAPLGFYLPGKIKLGVDGTPLTELEIGKCDQRGCFLSAGATPELIGAMKAGTSLQIDFAPAENKRQSIDVPLTGFTRAMEAIQ